MSDTVGSAYICMNSTSSRIGSVTILRHGCEIDDIFSGEGRMDEYIDDLQ